MGKPASPLYIQPRGSMADTRIIGAIQNLCDQLSICGINAPVAIVFPKGERRRVQAAVTQSPMLLVEDEAATKPQIWGVQIREEGVDD